MNKMPDLKLEVIRFNTVEDVIVTSGAGLLGRALTPNTWYATIGSELIDNSITNYGNGNAQIKDNIRYWFQFNNNAVTGITTKASDLPIENATYAWFYNQWRTGDLFYNFEGDIPDLKSFTEYYTN